MAGGQGTRLWPKSRSESPKQLHALVGEKTLIAETFDRLELVTVKDKIVISTTPEYQKKIKEQLPDVPEENFVIEPYPMNTAAAIGLVSKIINLRDPESTISFFPSDHHIKDSEDFAATLKYAEKICDKFPESILTIGIKPTKADTGLGYIHIAENLDTDDDMTARRVERFVEKPDQETADKYLLSGEYLWNAGMFIWKTKHILELFEKDLPQTAKMLDAVAANWSKPNYDEFLKEHYKDGDNTSVDYGILEKEKDIIVIPADFGWSDIGNWGTLMNVVHEIEGSDVVARGKHVGVDNSRVLVLGQSDKLVATVGLEDIIVVDTPDVLLICNGKKDQQVKEIMNQLKDQGKVEYL